MVGYTKEEIEWKNNLRSDRNKAFAERAIELSRTFEISRDEVINLMNDIFWDSWDTSKSLDYKVKENYPLRSTND